MGQGHGHNMSIQRSPASGKSRKDYLRRQEARWARKSGPVVVRHVDPASLRSTKKP